MQDDGNDLVLGLVQGYSWRQIEPFVVSLRATGYTGHICFVYRDMPAEALSALQQAGIELVPSHLATVPAPGRRRTVRNIVHRLHRSPLGKFGLIPRVSRLGIETAAHLTREPHQTKARIMQSVLSVNMTKAPVWYLYLTRHHARYARVMLTDVRDVLFQRNPFDFQFGDELCIFLEDDGLTVETCPHTGPLVRDKFGADVFQQIATRTASCAGVTIGSTTAILQYLRRMIDETGLLDNFNQGMHSALFYRGAFDPVQVFRNDLGPVLTMAHIPPSALRIDRDGRLINARGDVINVLHQYDRLLGRDGVQLEPIEGTFRLTRPAKSQVLEPSHRE